VADQVIEYARTHPAAPIGTMACYDCTPPFRNMAELAAEFKSGRLRSLGSDGAAESAGAPRPALRNADLAALPRTRDRLRPGLVLAAAAAMMLAAAATALLLSRRRRRRLPAAPG
jgi:hypothetical protein